MQTKPIGSINKAYVGFLFMFAAAMMGCAFGGLAVYAFFK
jgi:hypothetical protein